MKTFHDLAKSARATDRAKESDRVLTAQWHLQNIACVQLALSLGLLIHWRTRRSNAWHDERESAGNLHSRTYDVLRVTACELPPWWHPVDPLLSEEYGGVGRFHRAMRLAKLARDRAEQERRRAREVADEQARTSGPGAVLDVLRMERFITAATGKA